MAAAHVQALGGIQSKASATSLVISPSSKTVTSGNDIFVVFSADTGGSAHQCNDNLGNTYAIEEEVNNSGNVRSILFRAPVTNAGSITSITISWTTNVSAKAANASEFSGVGTLSTTGGGLTGNGSISTAIDNKTVPQNGIAIWGAGYETDGTGIMTGAGTTSGSPALTRVNSGTGQTTTGGGDASNIACMPVGYALGNSGSDSTSFSGLMTLGAAGKDWAGSGGVYSPSGVSDLSINESESVTVTESVGMFTDILHRSVSDSVTVTESRKQEITSSISESENITVTEALSIAIALDVIESESVTVTESTKVESNNSITETENITVSENRTIFIPELFINKSENVSVSEVIQRLIENYIAESESVTVTESVKLLGENSILKSESVTLTESIGRLVENFINETESIGLTDTPTVSIEAGAADLTIDISDSITVTESIQRLTENYLNKSENITVSESRVFLIPELYAVKSESITVSESIQRVVESYINKSENISVTESAQLNIPVAIGVTENITVSESANILLPDGSANINVNESIGLTDTASLLIPTNFVNESESITITENTRVSIEGVVGVARNLTMLGVG